MADNRHRDIERNGGQCRECSEEAGRNAQPQPRRHGIHSVADEKPQNERADQVDEKSRVRPPIVVYLTRHEGDSDSSGTPRQSTDEDGENGLHRGVHTRQRTRVKP